MAIVWELLAATDPVSWELDPNADPATEDLPGRRVWLPLPGAADAGAVPVVKSDGSGYELVNARPPLTADVLCRSEGFDPTVGTFTEVVQVGPLGDEGNAQNPIPRAFLVGYTVAVIDTGKRWVITASGPCTAATTPKGWQQVIVGASIAGGPHTMIGVNGTSIIDPTAAATSLILANRSAYARRCNNVVTSLADEAGAANSIEPDPEGVTYVGGAYDGLPIYREVGHVPGDGGTVTFGGVTYTDPQTVVYLVNQQTSALNGAWELFTDTDGDYGTAGDAYFVRTVVWNSTTDDDPTSPMYCPAGNVFRVTGGDQAGLWSTSGDGLKTNAEPIVLDGAGGGGGVSLGETSTTAYRGDRGKTAYDHSQLTTGNPHGTTVADLGAVATSRTITAGTGLTGGGDLSANRTLALAAISDQRVLGNVSGSSAAPTELTVAQLLAMVGLGAAVRSTDATAKSQDTTLADDDTLRFTAAANSTYDVHWRLFVTSNASADFKTGISAPAGSTLELAVQGIGTGASALPSNQQLVGMINATTDEVSIGSVTGTDGVYVEIEGVIKTGVTSGTVAVKWAQATSHLSNTYVRALSSVRFLKIA